MDWIKGLEYPDAASGRRVNQYHGAKLLYYLRISIDLPEIDGK
jgi:hypothetical protein